jgi:hypothetical protein
MKSTVLSLAALGLIPASALAAGAFDGTWKASLDHIQLSKKPYVFVLSGGAFTCSSCGPAYTIKADGTDQKVAGHTGYDTESIAVTDAHKVKTTDKLKGKTVNVNTDTISADGATDTVESTDYTGAQPSTLRLLLTRVSSGAPGSHALSGSWLDSKVLALEGPSYTTTFGITDDGFTMSSNGQAYDAKFDGKKYPITGDPAQTQVVVKKLAANEVQESDYQQGKLIGIGHFKVSADGKTIHASNTSYPTHRTVHWTMDKVQSP